MTQLTIFPETTVTEVKAFLKENWKKGAICPCCKNRVQQYSRPITSSMAYGLIALFKAHGYAFVHIQDFFKATLLPSSTHGDFPKLKYWGLIEQDGDKEGFYRVTLGGVAFIHNELSVKSHVLLYNNKNYGFEGDDVNIKQCLKKKFNYSDLMAGTL